MVNPNSRKVVLLCFLILLNEFGPTHLARIKNLRQPILHNQQDNSKYEEKEVSKANSDEQKADEHKIDRDDEGEEKEIEENKSLDKAEKRGSFSTALKYVVKVLKFGNKVIPKLVTMAGFSNAVFRAIAGCCVDFPKACEGHEEVTRLRAEVEEKSNRLDNIQLEAKNIQEWTQSTSDKLAFVLFELHTIVDQAEILLGSMSPEVNIALEKRTMEIKKLVREKNSAGEKLNYLEVESMYFSTIDTSIGILVPIFTLILPSIPDIVKFAKKRMGMRKTYVLDHSLDGSLVKPAASSPMSVDIKSWMAKTRADITTKLNSFKEKINTKHGKAVKIFKTLGSALSLIFGYVTSGYEIYQIIENVKTCQKKQDNMLEAVKEFKKASLMLDEAIANATKSKGLIQEAWTHLHEDLSSEQLLKDLRQVSKAVKDIARTNTEMHETENKVQQYIDGVVGANNYSALYSIVQDLSTGLTSIPFTLGCYTNKVKMTEYVLRECKRGSDTFGALYTEGLQSFDTNADACRDKVGFTYIEKSTVLSGLTQMAKDQDFNTDCILNSELRINQACQHKDEGYSDEDIANKIGVTVGQVKALTKKCPKHGLTPKQINQICNFRKMLTNDQIASSLGLELTAVKAVKCPS